MKSDPQTISAFAFYNGLAGVTSSKKRRLRKVLKKESDDYFLNSEDIPTTTPVSNTEGENVPEPKRKKVSPPSKVVLSDSKHKAESTPKHSSPAHENGTHEDQQAKTTSKTKVNHKSSLKNNEVTAEDVDIPREVSLIARKHPKKQKGIRTARQEASQLGQGAESPLSLSDKNATHENGAHEVKQAKTSSKTRVNHKSSLNYNKVTAVTEDVVDIPREESLKARKHPKKQKGIRTASQEDFQSGQGAESPLSLSNKNATGKTKVTSPKKSSGSSKNGRMSKHKVNFVKHSVLEESDVLDNDTGKEEPSEEVPKKMSRTKKLKILKAKLIKEKQDFLKAVKKVTKHKIGSPDVGKKVLATLLSPTTVDEFFKVYWERKPLLIKRNQSGYFKEYLSIKEIDDVLRYNVLMFTRNIDITSYSDGKRETHNPPGRAHPHVVWDYYSNGCSIRILNPQTYLNRIHTLLAALQEYFGCFVGSNVYLTPPNSQGFAPHYDDIEAFVLQIEGSKRWKVYEPRSEEEVLPRYSSPNFTSDEIGEPIIDVILEPGDLLYFPRGYIHQAETLPGKHSLHITLSAYQKTAWIDLMEKAVPKALEAAWRSHVDFRKGLPLGYLNQAGYGYPTISTRRDLHIRMKKLLSLMENYLDVDSAVDAMGVRFMHEALPPVLSHEESMCSVYNGGIVMGADANLKNQVQLDKNTKIRLLRANCCRLVEEILEEEGLCAKLYTTVENSKVFEEEEPKFLVIPKEMVPAVHRLMASYPAFIPISTLPLASEEEKMRLANDLWDHGILLTEAPLAASEEINYEESDSDDD